MLLPVCICICFLGGHVTGWCSVPLLDRVMEAMEKSLYFMKREVRNINLDGAIGCRIADDQLSYLLDIFPRPLKSTSPFARLFNKAELLRNLAAKITNEATRYIRENQLQYYKSMGALLKRGQWNLSYPSRPVVSGLRTSPIKCREIPLREHISDRCVQELLGTNHDGNERCNISEKCWEIMTAPGYKGYALTHQVFYLEIGEMNGCFPRINNKSAKAVNYLQDYFCANVQRDAEVIAEHHFPDSDRDLFMEQVGLCGILGYEDMFQNAWLEEILRWQQPSGCYTTRLDRHWSCNDQTMVMHKIRHKREEKILKGNCLSHKTAVAIAALTTNLRFCFEQTDLHSKIK